MNLQVLVLFILIQEIFVYWINIAKFFCGSASPINTGLFFMQLASTEEYIDGQFTGNLGEVLIRYKYFLEKCI